MWAAFAENWVATWAMSVMTRQAASTASPSLVAWSWAAVLVSWVAMVAASADMVFHDSPAWAAWPVSVLVSLAMTSASEAFGVMVGVGKLKLPNPPSGRAVARSLMAWTAPPRSPWVNACAKPNSWFSKRSWLRSRL